MCVIPYQYRVDFRHKFSNLCNDRLSTTVERGQARHCSSKKHRYNVLLHWVIENFELLKNTGMTWTVQTQRESMRGTIVVLRSDRVATVELQCEDDVVNAVVTRR